MSDNHTPLLPSNTFYKPSELLGIFKNFLSNKEINSSLIQLQGIYLKSDKIYGNAAYDVLKDENSTEELTIIVPLSLRDNLKNGNLVTIFGTLDRNMTNKGAIQILVRVSRVDKVKDIAISEDEIKRAEARRRKGELGYKNVDGILENKLFAGKRPQVAIIYAGTSITHADFEKGLAAAKANIDFTEHRVSFTDSIALCKLIASLDKGTFDIIVLVRGGGSGIEKLDDLKVVETLTNLKTAWIYGVGHEKENLFIRNIADKVIPIPFAVGTYFRDTVEKVVQLRNNSRAVLVQEVKKQYEKQIETTTKANKELQENLEKQGKTLAEMQGMQRKQQEEFNKNLNQMQASNKDLQTNLTKLTLQNTEYNKQLEESKRKLFEAEQKKHNNISYIIAIASLTLALVWALLK